MTAEALTVGELARASLRRWRRIGAIVLGTAVLAVALSFVVTPRYRAEALVAPHLDNKSGAGALGALSGELGGLASIVGLDANGGSAKYEAVALLHAASTTRRLIEQDELLPVLFAGRWDADRGAWREGVRPPSTDEGVRMFVGDVSTVTEDRRTGLVTVGVTWTDPNLAARWATDLVRLVNDEMRGAAIHEAESTLKYLDEEVAKTEVIEMRTALFHLVEAQERNKVLAVVREDYALQVIDPATAPDRRFPVYPKHALFAALGILFGCLLSAVWIIALVSVERRRRT